MEDFTRDVRAAIRAVRKKPGFSVVVVLMLAVGIATWIGFQAFVNIGAMLSLLPLTGIPLPFISYGSSSLIMVLAATGLLVNISSKSR